jgi:hypothetical protein
MGYAPQNPRQCSRGQPRRGCRRSRSPRSRQSSRHRLEVRRDVPLLNPRGGRQRVLDAMCSAAASATFACRPDDDSSSSAPVPTARVCSPMSWPARADRRVGRRVGRSRQARPWAIRALARAASALEASSCEAQKLLGRRCERASTHRQPCETRQYRPRASWLVGTLALCTPCWSLRRRCARTGLRPRHPDPRWNIEDHH